MFYFILPYLPSFLVTTYLRILRSLEKGGQSQFLPWAISFPFLKFMFRRKKCFFLFLFLLQLSSLSWNLFLLSLTHLFPFFCRVLHFFVFFWTQDQSRLTSNFCCNDGKDMRNFDFLVIYFCVAFCNNDFNLKPGLIFFKFFKNRGF